MKWSPASVDQVKYDVLLPFTRQVSGPMDYTQGAMRNASKGNYYPCNSEPMSQGTRCRQLALYVVIRVSFQYAVRCAKQLYARTGIDRIYCQYSDRMG